MIKSFRCKDTGRLFRQEPVRRWSAIERQALRKLVQLDLRKAWTICAFHRATGWKP